MLSSDAIITVTLVVWVTQRTVGLEVCSQSEYCAVDTNDYSEFIGRYTFPTTPIRKFDCKSEEAIVQMKTGVSTSIH